MPLHLPLPRAVGPYAVIRTTKRFVSPSRAILFGTFQQPVTASDAIWSSVCAVEDQASATLPINTDGGARRRTMPMDGLGAAVTVCPAAFSVQIMNGQALQTTRGIVYAGVMNTQANIAGRAETWDSYFDKFVEFQNPRLMSAGKLALRGVQINSYPLNMSKVSEFTNLFADNDSGMTYNTGQATPVGWAPIMVLNSGADGASNPLHLEFLVTTEWRVRFDLDNPAAASHIHHAVANDMTWDKLMKQATAFGNGVRDIAEVVANVGQLVQRARPALMLA